MTAKDEAIKFNLARVECLEARVRALEKQNNERYTFDHVETWAVAYGQYVIDKADIWPDILSFKEYHRSIISKEQLND
tara:strand:- start:161 stop:394 length:234 start_codon:yes stop_codon:yes gene_type:complete